ncbi:MAG TPA: carboxypeptidase-like regulatory domain-containing protein [Pirellulales bacterium]|nr:carboxypeptidase-like regulatory domain-containing protein [Pirellulales bacterium]
MILESRFRPQVSRTSKLLIALVAVLILPAFFRFANRDAAAEDEKEKPAPASKAESPSQSEFPHSVKFEQGATKFLDGDKITIVEVRGTAETFKPGEIYWIKGTYTLSSHDRATLAAYTTAKNAADGRSKSFTAQTTTVKKGSGDFTLFLPMACEGWPHVSFYPADGGEGFGGNYFGTGDSVLKRWWGSKESDDPTKDDKSATKVQTSPGQWRAFGRVTDATGQPLAGVEIRALCGGPTPGLAGAAMSGEDGRYELDFNPLVGPTRNNRPSVQSTLIWPRKPGYFEENLNRQGNCLAGSAPPDEAQLKTWHVAEDHVFLPNQPLEINFVMRPAAKAAGRLVDEQGQPLVGYSVSLDGPDLYPATSVASDARTDEEGRFVLENIPTTFRYQFTVRKAKPKPPWNDSWASAALRFDRTETEDLRAWLGDREIRVDELVLRVVGEGVHGKTATRLAGNAGKLDLTVDHSDDVLEKSDGRLAVKSAVLTLTNAIHPDISRSLVNESVPTAPAVAFPTRLARSQANESGELVISFENPPGFDLVRGKHQVIFQVFVGASQRPIREKIFRQLDIEEGRYEVPVKISPELIDDSRVSITFVTIQPDHDAWVKAFFHEGKGTSYRGLWTSDGDILPAVPFALAR